MFSNVQLVYNFFLSLKIINYKKKYVYSRPCANLQLFYVAKTH